MTISLTKCSLVWPPFRVTVRFREGRTNVQFVGITGSWTVAVMKTGTGLSFTNNCFTGIFYTQQFLMFRLSTEVLL